MRHRWARGRPSARARRTTQRSETEVGDVAGQPVNIHELAQKLRQQGVDPAHQIIYLRADERVPFGAFASLMDAVKQAGITNISIVTQPLEAKASTAGGN